jgi:hypothetical protein
MPVYRKKTTPPPEPKSSPERKAEQKKPYTEDDLMKKIGRLEVENDFLRSVSLALGLDIEKPR